MARIRGANNCRAGFILLVGYASFQSAAFFCEPALSQPGKENDGVATTPSSRPNKQSTVQQFEEFTTKLQEKIDESLSQPTAAKQRDMAAKVVKELDSELRKRKWTLFFRISDVSAGRSASEFAVEPPKGIALQVDPRSLGDQVAERTSDGRLGRQFNHEGARAPVDEPQDPKFYARSKLWVRIPYGEAVKIVPGQYVRIAGTPRIALSSGYDYQSEKQIEGAAVFRRTVHWQFSDRPQRANLWIVFSEISTKIIDQDDIDKIDIDKF